MSVHLTPGTSRGVAAADGGTGPTAHLDAERAGRPGTLTTGTGAAPTFVTAGSEPTGTTPGDAATTATNGGAARTATDGGPARTATGGRRPLRDPALAGHGGPASRGHVVGLVLGLSAVLAVVVTAFAWPASRSSAHDVPIAVAGPAAAVAQVEQRLDEARPGAFDVTALPDEEAARRAIADRDVYGAVVVGPQGASVLTASAASPAVAQGLTELARVVSGQEGPGVIDLAPTTADDPRGAGLGSAALPLVLAGLAGAAVLSLRVSGTGRRFTAAAALAVVAGAAITAVLQPWLGILDGAYVANAAVVALGIAAVVFPVLGLVGLLGAPGIGLGAALMMLLGNPFSGAATAPEMLPGAWGAFGQLMPPGATGTLLRSVAFFDGAAATRPLIVLAAWTTAGALLMLAGLRRRGV